MGRLASVSGHGNTFTYKYLDEMNVNTGYYLGTKVNGHVDLLETSRTYEAGRMFVDKVENTWDGAVISSFDYTNDVAGRRTHRIDSGSAFTNGEASNTFTYDEKSQVEGAVMGEIKDGTNVTHSLTSAYEYDELGNRTSSSEAFVDPIEPNYSKSWGYTPTDLNQYSDIKLASQSLTTPQYDFDGNMTLNPVEGGNNWTYTWNAENRLIKAVNDDKELTFKYDLYGRRIRKTVKTTGGTIKKNITFMYDGWNMIQELDTIEVPNQSSCYLWGLDLSGSLQGVGGVGGLLAVERGGQTFYPTYDANGSISEYLDYTGTVEAHYEYDPFGAKTSGGNSFPFSFSTKYVDNETGFAYYGYRFYSANYGCWLNRDPVAEFGGNNLYGFVGNNPISNVDILGNAYPGSFGPRPAPRLPLTPQQICDNWIEDELEDMDWLDEIPSCPAKLNGKCKSYSSPPGWSEPEYGEDVAIIRKYHPNAHMCIRSTDNKSDSGQQCCYKEDGGLITDGAAAGTPDRVRPAGGLMPWDWPRLYRHYVADVRMFDYCKKHLGDSWVTKDYLRVRPPDTTPTYYPPLQFHPEPPIGFYPPDSGKSPPVRVVGPL